MPSFKVLVATIICMAIGAGCIALSMFIVTLEVRENRAEMVKGRQVSELILEVTCRSQPDHEVCREYNARRADAVSPRPTPEPSPSPSAPAPSPSAST